MCKISQGLKSTFRFWKSVVIGLRKLRLVSADARWGGARDESLRDSAGEATCKVHRTVSGPFILVCYQYAIRSRKAELKILHIAKVRRFEPYISGTSMFPDILNTRMSSLYVYIMIIPWLLFLNIHMKNTNGHTVCMGSQWRLRISLESDFLEMKTIDSNAQDDPKHFSRNFTYTWLQERCHRKKQKAETRMKKPNRN